MKNQLSLFDNENKPYTVKELRALYSNVLELSKRVKIQEPDEVYKYLLLVIGENIEHREMFVAVYLNRANNIVAHSIIGVGGVSGTVADPKIIFQNALTCNASGLILCHNHPSGNPKPSGNDIKLTKKIEEAGKFLDIDVFDHLIITTNDYFSFAGNGLIKIDF
jgi:DNA repair protein RadC